MAGNVLIVEPDMRLADLYARAFRSQDKTVTAAHNAQDAILAADACCPDVVVVELQLSVHSGLEFLYEFRSYAEWRRIPVIILSNVPPEEFSGSHTLLHDHLGVVAYLYKPHTDLRVLLHSTDMALTAWAGGAKI